MDHFLTIPINIMGDKLRSITLVIVIIISGWGGGGGGGGGGYKSGNTLKILEHQFGLNKFTIILNFRRKTSYISFLCLSFLIKASFNALASSFTTF